MVRRTLLAVFSSISESKGDSAKIISELVQHFYKVCLDDIPKQIPESIFSVILHDPVTKNLFMSLHADTLVFILSVKDKVCYIGVMRDALSRQWSMELPTKFNWSDLIECAKQTPRSLISFL